MHQVHKQPLNQPIFTHFNAILDTYELIGWSVGGDVILCIYNKKIGVRTLYIRTPILHHTW